MPNSLHFKGLWGAPAQERDFWFAVDIYTKAEPMQIRNSQSTNKHFLSNPDNEMDDSLFSQNFSVITFLLTFQRKWKRLPYNWLKEIEVINQARKSLKEMCTSGKTTLIWKSIILCWSYIITYICCFGCGKSWVQCWDMELIGRLRSLSKFVHLLGILNAKFQKQLSVLNAQFHMKKLWRRVERVCVCMWVWVCAWYVYLNKALNKLSHENCSQDEELITWWTYIHTYVNVVQIISR